MPPTETNAEGNPVRSVARGVRRDVVAAVEIAEIRAPPELVRFARPHEEVLGLDRRCARSIVEHGTVEQLEGGGDLPAVAGEPQHQF